VSLFLAFITLEVVGIRGDDAILLIALIFPFDRLLDMMRTATNVTGDAAVATAVAKWEGELDEEVFRTPARV
jgi:Na+/H+-dicarboxylate symporter